MTTHYTHCALRLGDNLAHLHFLRKLALAYPDHRFVHAAHLHYLPQLVEVVCDVENITLQWIDDPRKLPEWWEAAPANPYSIDAWKNKWQKWERHSNRHHYAGFMLEHFDELALQLSKLSGKLMRNPLRHCDDLLFDYPAIQHYAKMQVALEPQGFDFLVVNSSPASGQAPAYDEDAMAVLARSLRGLVITTKRVASLHSTEGMSVSAIGGLSLHCKYIVAVSTGPSWPTFNIWNKDTVKLRVLLLKDERVEIAPNTVHVETVQQAADVLKERGLL